MSFTSPVFFLFLPAVLLIYWVLPGKYRWIHLLVSSCFFYAFYDVRLLGLIFITIIASYLSALRMEQAETQKGRRTALLCTMIACLGILFGFKYLNFAVGSAYALFHLFGAEVSFDGFPILLPMGISFYVFQTLSYAFDVYRSTEYSQHTAETMYPEPVSSPHRKQSAYPGQEAPYPEQQAAYHKQETSYSGQQAAYHKQETPRHGNISAERHLGYYALFVIFFPQLVAGPIERPGCLLPQLKNPPAFCKEALTEGFARILRGYAKKLLIADYLAGYVDMAYENIYTAGGAALLAATFLFAIQIYCDFSGYTDIAIGCAECMGIRLSENFRRPYSAVSIRDFWQRWHISLTRWFTDYLYIPLGGSRKGLVRHCANILLTFLVSGLWHGANWTFVFWGGLHGIFLVAETLFSHAKHRKTIAKESFEDFSGEPFRALHIGHSGRRLTGSLTSEPPNRFSKPSALRTCATILRRCLVFLLVCFAWIFFRAATVTDAFWIIQEILTHWQLENLFPALGLTQTKLLMLLLLVILLPLLERLPAYQWTTLPLSKAYSQCNTALLYFLIITAICLCVCIILTEQGMTSFIYFQF